MLLNFKSIIILHPLVIQELWPPIGILSIDNEQRRSEWQIFQDKITSIILKAAIEALGESNQASDNMMNGSDSIIHIQQMH